MVPLSYSVLCFYRKQCIHSYDVYDFLKNVASKVPDLGAPDSSADDKLGKRRKHGEDESEEETKRTRNVSLCDPYLSVYVTLLHFVNSF